MKLKLCFSTCPNDTFMFEALVNKRIDLQGLSFDIQLSDIEELNAMAARGEADVTKISFNAFAKVANSYQLLNSGSALGRGVGPLVVSSRKIYPDEIPFAKIAIPGTETTANMLFSIAFPNTKDKRVYLFSDIEDAILSNEVDAGVIIHENRFTYEKKGLKKVVDLGEFWEHYTGLPIPLGGIVIKRDIPKEIKLKFDTLLRKSIEYAFKYPHESIPYIKKYAQAMDEEVMQKHIQLYVNDFSIDLGDEGRNAIKQLYSKAFEVGLIPQTDNDLFLNDLY